MWKNFRSGLLLMIFGSMFLTSCSLYNAHIKANLLNSEMLELFRQGQYAQAKIKAEQVLELRRSNLGEEHRYVATTLNDLAEIYRNLGLYEKAKPLYEKANALWEKNLGSEHRYLGTGFNNLATLYFELGDYDKVEPLLNKALKIRLKAYGKEHYYVAQTMNNLAMYYQNQGDFEKAVSLYQQAIDIFQKTASESHVEIAQTFENLASCYQHLRDYKNAETFYLQALKLKEQALGLNHPDLGLCLNNLGSLYKAQGYYQKAEALFEKALQIFGKTFGHQHPWLALSYGNLATLKVATGDYASAQNLYEKALQIDEDIIQQVLGFTSEQEKLSFLNKVHSRLNIYISLVNQYLSKDPVARIKAFNALNQRKGLILKTHQKFLQALFHSDDKQALQLFRELSNVRAQISRQTFSLQKIQSEQSLEELIAEKELLEAKLRKVSKEFTLSQKLARVNSVDIAQALPKHSVLIEFARIDGLNFSAINEQSEWMPAHYLAFIIHAGQGGEVSLIDLGEAKKIDNAIANYKRTISNPNDLEWQKQARAAHDLIFAPLKPLLKNINEVFISPEGSLSLIPFEVLLMPNKHFLIEEYSFNYLANGSDLLRFNQSTQKTGKALIMGAPDFELGGRVSQDSETGSEEVEKRTFQKSIFHFAMLPETEKEAKAIAKILGANNAEIYLGKQALESVLLKNTIPPKILHLATHGFFLDEQNWQYFLTQLRRSTKTETNIGISNPLLRSGFALSGANHAFGGESLYGDGIITAEKILGLHLRGTQMVVLSACETGLGEVQLGEGVYGLRRAFTQVGAKSLVMSMWSVPDLETRELMVAFYQNLALGNMNRNQALRKATLKLMKQTRQKYGQAHPLFWGAFVFMGEP